MAELTLERRVELLEEQITAIKATVDGFIAAYVSKLQWKQLDNLREGDIQALTDSLTGIDAEINSIKAQLP